MPKISTQSPYNALFIGTDVDHETLKKKIALRITKRMKGKNNMVAEAQSLHRDGLSWKRMEALGLEYRFFALFLQNKLTRIDMLTQLEIAIGQYARRQMAWFKRNKKIVWMKPTATRKIEQKVRAFLR